MGYIMFKRLPFPWAYGLELLLAVPLFLSFYLLIAFVASTPAEEVRASGAVIPAHWEATLSNHGEYLRGFLPGAHPWLFGAVVVSFIGLGFMTWQLRLAQAQQQAAAAEHAWRHKVARIVTGLTWVLVGVTLFSFGLPYLVAA